MNQVQAGMATVICERIEKAVRQVGVPENQVLFYGMPYPGRLVCVFNPNILPQGISPALARRFADALEGRRVRVTLGRILQVGYVPSGAVRAARQELPGYRGMQIVVYGPTGSGKSSAIQHILRQRDGMQIVFDAHYAPGNWHPNTIVIGAGRNWAAIDQALDVLVLEMAERYRQKARGMMVFPPITVAVDEMSALTSNVGDAGKRLITLAQEGRKVNINTILTPHSTEVVQMGFEGAGDARENFVFIELDAVIPGREQQPRTCKVYIGNPRRRGNEASGRFLIPAPVVYQGTARMVSDLAAVLQGMSEGASGGVSGPMSQMGHGADTDKTAEFDAAYRPGSPDAQALAEFLASHGYGVRKISMVLPYRAELARQTAADAIRVTGMDATLRPAPGSQAERALVHELSDLWGVPANRIARLLDGQDHQNMSRVQTHLGGGR